MPAMLQMTKDIFMDKENLLSNDYEFWLKKAADTEGDPALQMDGIIMLIFRRRSFSAI